MLDDSGRKHGHLLALGFEVENLFPPLREPGGALTFFQERAIKWWRSGKRGGDTQGEHGPTRNLTSSQLACVNFLLPLASHPRTLAAMLRGLDDDVVEVIDLEYPLFHSAESVHSFVELEWVGRDRTLEGGVYSRGAHATSTDALIVAGLRDGTRRAYLIEWKFTEHYPSDRWLGMGSKGDVRRARYASWHARGKSLDASVPLDELLYDPIYQIVRLAWLGDSMVDLEEFDVREARVVIVCPEENREYRETITSPLLRARFPDHRTLEALLGGLWRDRRGFRMTSPSELLGAISDSGTTVPPDWMEYVKERYRWDSCSVASKAPLSNTSSSPYPLPSDAFSGSPPESSV